MATPTKFNSFITAVAAGTHAAALNANTATLKVYLTNAAPDVAADSLKADLAEISTGNGYTGPVDAQNDASQTGGTITVALTDVTITASGGSVGPFRYAVLYNDDATNDPLVCYWDYGSAITLADGESFVLDFTSSLTLA